MRKVSAIGADGREQAAKRDGNTRTPAATKRDRLAELERENRELKRANEILRKAVAYHSLAQLRRA
jgi:transposase